MSNFSKIQSVERWVDKVADVTRPKKVIWCDGSEEENSKLVSEMLEDGILHKLNPEYYPDCFLHRSNPNDVARSEQSTFICSEDSSDAGPTNNWMSPLEAKKRVWPFFKNCMEDKTMYVAPYLMGHEDSPYSKIGIEITDSPYVVANLRIMTRMGDIAMDKLNKFQDWVPGLHSVADLDPERRYILHFPETKEVWSINSGYGGNALLNKKCFALRIASNMARHEGWLAEHMLILEIESPEGETTYMAGAFPSACGKTNLAMLRPPVEAKGWKIKTIGDDIAWLHIGEDGRLRAVNPENGYFGVAPGTNYKTNPNAMETIKEDTIFTNVAMTPDKKVWWEDIDRAIPPKLVDWQGRSWTPESGGKAAHPNARFTAPAYRNPGLSSHFEDPQGVPISAIIFGGRRAQTIPLIFASFNFQHGVYLGATISSETTAAAAGAVGVVRRDPMAMLPFCGYNMADYFQHWLDIGKKLKNPPLIINWNVFRKNDKGEFIYPGFQKNFYLLKWISELAKGKKAGIETPLGIMPTNSSLDLEDMGISGQDRKTLFLINKAKWELELKDQEEFLGKFGEKLPPEIQDEVKKLKKRLNVS